MAVHCHHADESGKTCSAQAIVKAIGLEMKDRFPPSLNGSAKSKPKPPCNGGNWKDPKDAAEWIAKEEHGRVSDVGPWVYLDRDRDEVMRVYRIELPKDKKRFVPMHPTIAGNRWRIGDPSKSGLPLYHLDELDSASDVYVVEGEKCADLAPRGLGIVVATSSHGSQSPQKTDWTPLAGKNVMLIPDHDQTGEGYIDAVGSILAGLDPKPSVKVVRLPLQEVGDDIEQWLAACPDTWGPDECREALARLPATPWVKHAEPKPQSEWESLTNGELGIISGDEVDPQPVDWLWPNRIARKKMTIIAGEGKVGKTQIVLATAVLVSTGGELPDGSGRVQKGTVIILSAEDDPADTLAPPDRHGRGYGQDQIPESGIYDPSEGQARRSQPHHFSRPPLLAVALFSLPGLPTVHRGSPPQLSRPRS